MNMRFRRAATLGSNSYGNAILSTSENAERIFKYLSLKEVRFRQVLTNNNGH